jgi:hypothetical protein
MDPPVKNTAGKKDKIFVDDRRSEDPVKQDDDRKKKKNIFK